LLSSFQPVELSALQTVNFRKNKSTANYQKRATASAATTARLHHHFWSNVYPQGNLMSIYGSGDFILFFGMEAVKK
jgi:hypothetical protein